MAKTFSVKQPTWIYVLVAFMPSIMYIFM